MAERTTSAAPGAAGDDDLAIVDAHVHFWDPARLHYPWLAALPSLDRAFLPAEYAAAIGDAPVDRVVFVEANCRPDEAPCEVEFVERLGGGGGAPAAGPRVAGIVAFVDLASAQDGQAALHALASPHVKGVRQNIQGRPSGFCLQPAFVEGVRQVGRRGLTFDLCATHDQLPEVVELVRRCPDTRFVLDHCGKPAVRTGDIAAWARDVAQLAAEEHVCCKLSGLLTEADATPRRAADLAPYAAHVVDRFGPGRLLYGSDWPVLTLAGDYADWYGFTRALTAAWSADERRAFYGGNASRVYGL